MTKVHLTSEVVAAHEAHDHDDHDHDHHENHGDAHGHEHHDHNHESGNLWTAFAGALHLPGYGHTHERPALDAAYENELGIRAVRLAFILLAITTIIQIVIYLNSGSVALLADTVHNLGDALNSLPLWVAFVLLKRAPTRRYTYGFGRAEDLAGLVIVASIVFSAGYIIWETAQKLINPVPIALPGWVAAAAVVGFLGNEAVALIQIRAGKQIGSEAMIADGQHARVDGLTSLAVLAAVIGTWIGLPIIDPLVGVLIGVVIIFIARDAAIAMWHRLMDAVDPALVEKAEQVLASHDEIKQVMRIRMRWVGHRLYANAIVALDDKATLLQAEEISDHIEHHLLHDIPHIYDVQISMVPAQAGGAVVGKESKHHREAKS